MSAAPKAHGAKRRPKRHEEEHENGERWLLSYVDMVTVLMCLFIVLFAISQVDQTKFLALKSSLTAGFNDSTTSAASVLDGSTGALEAINPQTEATVGKGTAGMVTADSELGSEASNPQPAPAPTATANPNAVDPAVLAAARAEVKHLEELQAELEAALAANGLGDAVQFRINERGLIMGLVADNVFFTPNSAVLTATAGAVLDVAGPTLLGIGEQISIEGHANTVPTSGRYATNWELSADRATQVLRHLVEGDGMPPTRIMSVGFGDSRPLVAGDSPEALMANRRVDLVVLSSASEQVRNLLPAVIAAEG